MVRCKDVSSVVVSIAEFKRGKGFLDMPVSATMGFVSLWFASVIEAVLSRDI